eukprot:TRINITY_DN44894_c0_g1_i1.p1 TRINITY_DN44894_c0_g1~~TRINITY_DN44894_c0_g1_i1.p1  ORF type:complete len:325 (-),score=62.57 TRINITY_DN44894_c0_g1_i1:241-1215(-)
MLNCRGALSRHGVASAMMWIAMSASLLFLQRGGASSSPSAFSVSSDANRDAGHSVGTRSWRLTGPAPGFAAGGDMGLTEQAGSFAGAASAVVSSAMAAGPGAALAIFGAVALLGGGSSPRRRYRRVWRRQVVPDDVAESEAQTEVKEFVKPALWNRQTFRAVAIASGGAVAGAGLPFVSLLHLCSYGIWLGANVWTTFVAGITMYKSLPRQTFGKLQAKLFPKYFQMGAACSAALLLTSMRLGLPIAPSIMSLVSTLSNLFYFEPEATKIMFQRYDREDQGLKDPVVDKDLKARFGKLHGLSSLANLLTLVGLVAHGSLLAARL